MDGLGIPNPEGSRAHQDDANYSPSRSPPLLHSVSGNNSSSGSPSGSRRYGSIGEKEKRSREERLKLLKERQEQEHEKRLAELKAAAEKEGRIRQMKDAERLRRINEIKMKEALRRQAVEERRRRLETEDREKREQILAKYKEYDQKMIQRDQKKPVYAFGSSTPRTLAYLEHLDNSLRVYDSRLGSATGADEESAAASGRGGSPAEKRAVSASSLVRKALTATSSPNLSPHQQHLQRVKPIGVQNNSRAHVPHHSTKGVLPPSGRWGGSMVASMYGGSVAVSTTTARTGAGHRDPLANFNSMTASFAVGETSAAPHAKNVRTKGPLTSPASARSQSTTRLARSAASPRKLGQENQQESHKATSANAAANQPRPKGVSSARTPSAPPTARRPVGEAVSKQAFAPVPSNNAAKDKHKIGPKTTSKQSIAEASVPKIIRKPKAAPESINAATSLSLESDGLRVDGNESVVVNAQPHQFARPYTPEKGSAPNASIITLDDDHLRQFEQQDIQPVLETVSPVSKNIDHGNQLEHSPAKPDVDTDESRLTVSTVGNLDLNATIDLSSGVPKATGQSIGKVLSKEEAAAALAERRRVAREQLEKEKELERMREEQRRLEEEEMRRREEEEFRRQEQEEREMMAEAQRLELERIRQMAEEQEKRRQAEEKEREEEQRKKAEAEARAREEAERAEKERREAEEKFRKDELERSERKKRLEAIMQRTRQSGTPVTSTPVSRQQEGGRSQVLSNGNNDHANETVYFTPDSTNGYQTPATQSASSSVLKKLATTRPEIGRSLENILLKSVKSTPNVSDIERSAATGELITTSASMTTSHSADKVDRTPINGDVRLTQSFYATPAEHLGKSFNISDIDDGTDRTEYDIDASGTNSQSHYAKILSNQETPDSGKALASILADDSNANQQTPTSIQRYSGLGDRLFDHNDNVNSATVATPNGHHGVGSISLSGNSILVAETILNQKTSHDVSLDDPFGSSPRWTSAFEDSRNISSDQANQAAVKTIQSTSLHQERPLLEF